MEASGRAVTPPPRMDPRRPKLNGQAAKRPVNRRGPRQTGQPDRGTIRRTGGLLHGPRKKTSIGIAALAIGLLATVGGDLRGRLRGPLQARRAAGTAAPASRASSTASRSSISPPTCARRRSRSSTRSRSEERALREQIRAAHEQLRAALESGAPDADALDAQVEALGALKTQHHKQMPAHADRGRRAAARRAARAVVRAAAITAATTAMTERVDRARHVVQPPATSSVRRRGGRSRGGIGRDLEQRFDAFVNGYRDRAVRIAWRLLGGDAAAEDVAQEAFARAYRGLARFRDDAKLSTWFYRILVNEVRRHQRWRMLRGGAIGRPRARRGAGSEHERRRGALRPGAAPPDRRRDRGAAARTARGVRARAPRGAHRRGGRVGNRARGRYDEVPSAPRDWRACAPGSPISRRVESDPPRRRDERRAPRRRSRAESRRRGARAPDRRELSAARAARRRRAAAFRARVDARIRRRAVGRRWAAGAATAAAAVAIVWLRGPLADATAPAPDAATDEALLALALPAASEEEALPADYQAIEDLFLEGEGV